MNTLARIKKTDIYLGDFARLKRMSSNKPHKHRYGMTGEVIDVANGNARYPITIEYKNPQERVRCSVKEIRIISDWRSEIPLTRKDRRQRAVNKPEPEPQNDWGAIPW